MPSYTIPVILESSTDNSTFGDFWNGSWTLLGGYTNITFSDDDTLGVGDNAPSTETNMPALVTEVDGDTSHPLVGQAIYFSFVRTDDGDGDTDGLADAIFISFYPAGDTSGTVSEYAAAGYPGSGWTMDAGDTFISGGGGSDHVGGGPSGSGWSIEGFPDGTVSVPSPCPVFDAIMYQGPMVTGSDNLSVADGELINVQEPLQFNTATPGQIAFGDTVVIGSTTWNVTNTATQLITINYANGTMSQNETGYIIEVNNGFQTQTFIFPADGTDYENIVSIDTNRVSGFGSIDCDNIHSNDSVTLVAPPPDPCLIYDLIQTNQSMPNVGNEMTYVDGELIEIDEPVQFGGGTNASGIEVGEFMYTADGTFEVTGLEIHTVNVTYDGGTNTIAKMTAIEVFDGTNTFTYYLPYDGSDYPDITEIEVLGVSSPYNALKKGEFVADDDVSLICFARGTHIATSNGAVVVQDLAIGDRVLTADNGFQEIRWIGERTVPAKGNLAPIVFKAGTMGCERDLTVSPQHRILVKDWQADLLFGSVENLVAAKHLVNGDTIYRQQGGDVTYFHILFDEHELVFSEGIATESFHPGEKAVEGLDDGARAELWELFPDMMRDVQSYGPSVRTSLKKFEVDALMA